MQVSNFAMQQAVAQLNIGTSMVKQNAKMEQALVNMVTEAVEAGRRGQVLDIQV